MGLGKLGATPVQQHGDTTGSNRTYDEINAQVLANMLTELKYIRECLMSMSGLDLEQIDVE